MLGSRLDRLSILFIGVFLRVINRRSGLVTGLLVGTNNGYDVGGNESVCVYSETILTTPVSLHSLPRNTSLNDLDSLDGTIAVDTSEIFDTVESTLFASDPDGTIQRETDLLNQCYNGTEASVAALELDSKSFTVGSDEVFASVMFPEKPYTFLVTIRVDAEQISNGNHSHQGIFFRFVLCDLVNGGWCNPTFESQTENDLQVVVNSTTKPIEGIVDFQQGLVRSPWILPKINAASNNASIVVDDLRIQFMLPSFTPLAIFRFVLHTSVLLLDSADSSNSTFVRRVDVATLAIPPVVSVEKPPNILTLSQGIKILIYCMIAIFDVIAIMTLFYLLRHKDHPAIQLAQGKFLMVIVAASIVGGTFLFAFIPERDLYCRMRGPCVLFPFNLIGAIMVARQWRIYVSINGALKLGRGRFSDKSVSSLQSRRWSLQAINHYVDRTYLIGMFVNCLSFIARLELKHTLCDKTTREHRRQNSSSLRATATAAQATQLVVFILLPQIVLLIVGGIVDPQRLELNVNQQDNVARYACNRDERWISSVTQFQSAITFLMLLLLAWQSKDLPSFLNEKAAIFNTSLFFAVMLFVNIVLLATAVDTVSSPNTSVFVITLTLLASLLVLLHQIVWPKICRAAKGEEIILGNVLRLDRADLKQTNGTEVRATFMSGEPIVQKKDDPLPGTIEDLIFYLLGLFNAISNKCGDGQPLSAREWKQLMRNVSKLNNELGRVSLAFTEDDEKAPEIDFTISSTPGSARREPLGNEQGTTHAHSHDADLVNDELHRQKVDA